MLDLLQHEEVVEEDVLPLRAEEGVDGGSHRDEPEPQVLAQLGAAAMELEVIEAGHEEHGREDQLRQLGEHLPAGEGGDGSHQERAFGQGRHAGIRLRSVPHPEGEHDAARRVDGGGRNQVGAVAVVLDARVRGQAAHAPERDPAREHLVGAVHFSQGQRDAARRRRRGSQLHRPPEPAEGNLGAAALPPAHGDLQLGPARIVQDRDSTTPGRLRAVASTPPRWTRPGRDRAAGPPCRGARQRRPRRGSMPSARR